MGMFDGECKYCGEDLSGRSSIEYSRPNPNPRVQGRWNYCDVLCYGKGKEAYDKEVKRYKAGPDGVELGFFGSIAQALSIWLATKVLPFILPFVGWFGVVLLPFFLGYGNDLGSIPMGIYIFALIVGIGIALAIKLVRLPEKFSKFEKFRKPLLWLPIIVTVLIIVITVVRLFV